MELRSCCLSSEEPRLTCILSSQHIQVTARFIRHPSESSSVCEWQERRVSLERLRPAGKELEGTKIGDFWESCSSNICSSLTMVSGWIYHVIHSHQLIYSLQPISRDNMSTVDFHISSRRALEEDYPLTSWQYHILFMFKYLLAYSDYCKNAHKLLRYVSRGYAYLSA